MQRCTDSDTSDTGGSCGADGMEGATAGSNKRNGVVTGTPISHIVPFVSIKITPLYGRIIFLLVGPKSSPFQLSAVIGLKSRGISF